MPYSPKRDGTQSCAGSNRHGVHAGPRAQRRSACRSPDSARDRFVEAAATYLARAYPGLRPDDITDEMIQALDTAKRQALQKDLRALTASIRTDAEGRYASAEPVAGRSRVGAAVDREHRRPADRRPTIGSERQGVSPEQWKRHTAPGPPGGRGSPASGSYSTRPPGHRPSSVIKYLFPNPETAAQGAGLRSGLQAWVRRSVTVTDRRTVWSAGLTTWPTGSGRRLRCCPDRITRRPARPH